MPRRTPHDRGKPKDPAIRGGPLTKAEKSMKRVTKKAVERREGKAVERRTGTGRKPKKRS